MRIPVTITVLVLVNIHLSNILDTAGCVLFDDPNAHLKGASLSKARGWDDLSMILVAVIDLDVTIKT